MKHPTGKLVLTLGVCSVASLAMFVFRIDAVAPAPPTVTVSVEAEDTSGGTLSYRWRSSDGTIKNLNSGSTTWTLPNGPGLHFAYVLIQNGRGGFAEGRIAVNTDAIGTPPKTPPPQTLAAPPAPAQQGDFYRSVVLWGFHSVGPYTNASYAPNLPAYLMDTNLGTRYPSSTNAVTDIKGQVVIPGVPPGNTYALNCSFDGGATFADCTADSGATMLDGATTDYIDTTSESSISGSFTLADGTPCGTQNEFFGVHVGAQATLLDRSAHILYGPVSVNEFGGYSLPVNSNAATVRLNCPGAKAVTIQATGSSLGSSIDLGQTILPGVTPPSIVSMSATHNGTSVGIFLPPPSGLPSDVLTRADGYLSEKGVDSRMGACQYYKAVGAVRSCSTGGNLVGAISFEDWKRTVKIDKYAVAGTPEYSASYVNKMDLNLTRVHHSISYGSNQTAAYVCNHLGPSFVLVTAQQDIDTAVGNAVNGTNLVACVAMDYSVTSGVNNEQPFIRFLIFGPSGQLLPSINLDGRREKFVPGTCVVCHGGDHYAGKFPEDGSGPANVGGHFLPYDTGNFEFSGKPGLTEANQEAAIYSLNQNVLSAGPTPSEEELIAGWYAKGHTLNKNYLPLSWQGKGATAASFYRNVLARSCRSCHVAMIEDYNFDHYQNIAPGSSNSRFADVGFDVGINVCGGSNQIVRDHMMPNSLVTFNRLWLTYHNTAGLPNQPTIMTNFYGADTGATGSCTPGILP
jgi:hypothetical protein